MIEKMFELAVNARKNSYSPYSRFAVGACVLTEKGNMYAGCNVENAILHGICAEQNAITTMVANGERRIKEILVVGDGNTLVTPCGLCRQVIREFGDNDTLIHVAGLEGVRKTFKLSELLPQSFGPETLK